MSLQTIWNQLKELPDVNIKGTFDSQKLTKNAKKCNFTTFSLVSKSKKPSITNFRERSRKDGDFPPFWH